MTGPTTVLTKAITRLILMKKKKVRNKRSLILFYLNSRLLMDFVVSLQAGRVDCATRRGEGMAIRLNQVVHAFKISIIFPLNT